MRLTLSLAFMLATSMYASTVNLSLASDPSQYSSLYAIERLAPTAGSTDVLDYHQAILTAGPERSGYLQIQTGGNGGFVTFSQGYLHLGFAGGPVDGGIEIEAACGPQGCSPGNGYYGYNNRIPVTLGTTMTLEAVGNIAYCCTIGPGLYFTGGSVDGLFQLRFFESDGVTPVAVSDAPEPATWGMIGLTLVGAALLRKRRSMTHSVLGESYKAGGRQRRYTH